MLVFDDYGFSTCKGITHLVHELREDGNWRYIYNLNTHAIPNQTQNEHIYVLVICGFLLRILLAAVTWVLGLGHDNTFEILVALTTDTFQGGTYKLLGIVGRHDNRDRGK
jgi:hypothetical protein